MHNTLVDEEPEPRCYRIIRFRETGRRTTIRTNVTLAEAQAHCSDPKTRGVRANVRWFDGYDYMPETRTFIPASRFATSECRTRTTIRRWTWHRGRGITVTFQDGRTAKSEYTSLAELFRGERLERES